MAIINAYSFYKAGLRLKSDFASKELASATLFNAIPSTVNFCLSAEIILKVLISQNNLEFRKTHKLFDLFRSLPGALQTGVYECYKMIDPIEKTSFEDRINSVSNAFVEWRYYGVNEWNGSKNLPFDFAYRFSTILMNLALTINKNTAKLIKTLEAGN